MNDRSERREEVSGVAASLRPAGKPAKGMIRRAASFHADADRAVEELAWQLGGADLTAMVFFCGPLYDLDRMGRAIRSRFDCPVIGCTTAGEIFSPAGHLMNSLVGVGFATPRIKLSPFFIPSLTEYLKDNTALESALSLSGRADKRFVFFLIDGLAMLEERVVAAVHQSVQGIPLVGGSAGDGTAFRQTFVYYEGRFHSNAALVAFFEIHLPFKTFRIQHFTPTETKLVITEADTSTRTISEINGLPAAAEYARTVGLAVEHLSASVFAANPLMLRVGGEYFIRSILRANTNGSLTFACAIDNGLVLTLGKAENLLGHLRGQLDELAREMPDLQLVLGCECLWRRIELEQRGELDVAKGILSAYPVVGFNSYGEQYGGIHVNQTFTGVAIGGAHE